MARRYRITIGWLLALTVVFAIVGGGLRQFVLANSSPVSGRAAFVLFTLCAPVLTLVVFATGFELHRWLASGRR